MSNKKKRRLESVSVGVEFIDLQRKPRKAIFCSRRQSKILKCIRKELRKRGVIAREITKYLISCGEIEWRRDKKGFECLP